MNTHEVETSPELVARIAKAIAPLTLRDLRREAERELGLREKFYQRLYMQNRLSVPQGTRQKAMMEKIGSILGLLEQLQLVELEIPAGERPPPTRDDTTLDMFNLESTTHATETRP